MLKCGAQDRYFRFLTLVEVFPTMKKKITEADYWDDFQWTFAKQVKQEKEKAQACRTVLYEFKHKRQYNIDDCRRQLKTVPKDFDESFNYLKLLTLRDDNYDFETRIPAKLWVRELFMKGQTNILQLNPHL